MSKRGGKIRLREALTLLELVIAMAMIGIIFAAILPQFAIVRSSWDSKQGSAEALQNGRVLMDHINRILSKAVWISTVSDSSVTSGYIQFVANDSNTYRYDIGANNYVEYGPIGNLADLAGPVSLLKFTCYDACDLDTPITDVNFIRTIRVDATVTNPASMGQDKTFTTWVYLRVNAQSQVCWQRRDIGAVSAAGTATCSGGRWTIEGSGANISGTSDEFHYVYQSLSGDGQIIARVVSIENTHIRARAGAMIRETLNANSKHAMMAVTPGDGIGFRRRTSTGGSTNQTDGSSVTAPYWVKITRIGNTFTGYESPNGSAWTLVGSVSITMTTDVYIGLAVTSHNDGTLCTAVFDNVTIFGVTYETFNEQKTSSGVSLNISTPATNTGDLLIAAVATDSDTSSSLAPPSGWTAINVDDYSGEVTLGAWWRLAEASEPATHQFTWTGARPAYGWMMRFTGHSPTNPINASSPSGQTGSTPTSPAVTTTVQDCLILRLGAFDDSDITVDNPGLSGHTPITMDSSSGAIAILGSWVTGTTHAKESGTNRALIFIAHAEEGGAIGLNSVTYGGQPMTKIIDMIVGTTTRAYVVAYILNESGVAAATSNTFVPTWSTTPDYFSYSSVFLQSVNQTTPTGASASNGTAGSTPNPITTTALYTGNGDMVIVAATCGNSGSYTLNNGFTEGTDQTMGGTATGVTGRKSATGASETPSATHSGPNRQVIIGFVVQGIGLVSGGAGYVRQSTAGSSGTSTFTLTASNEAQMLTIAIAPAGGSSVDCCGTQLLP